MTPTEIAAATGVAGAKPDSVKAAHATPGAAELAQYFQRVETTFRQAAGREAPIEDRIFRLAEDSVRLRFAGRAVVPVVAQALAHLPATRFAGGLDVLCWDGASTGVSLPPPPWPWPSHWPPGNVIYPFGDKSTCVSVLPDLGIITLFRAATGQAVFWTRDARALHTYHYGSPLLAIFSWWAKTREISLVHAGCVGTGRGAVLLVGRGGSGKSTTSLLCAEAGMNYLSDDYCLVRATPVPTAFSLYCSGKLQRENLPRFPKLADHAVDPHADQFGKPVIFLRRELGYAVTEQLPLRAVLVPVVTGRSDTAIAPASAADALRALAPSTLMQLPGEGPDSFRALAQVVRAVPCLRLNLGTRFEAIPSAIRSLLDQLA